MNIKIERVNENIARLTLNFNGKEYCETWQHEPDGNFSITGKCITTCLKEDYNFDLIGEKEAVVLEDSTSLTFNDLLNFLSEIDVCGFMRLYHLEHKLNEGADE